jgi:hypothetical protein
LRKTIFITLGLLLSHHFSTAQAFLSTPIDGNHGIDWIIVNYVDWELDGHLDHNCGSKSYDGHQGTDFTLESFAQMDSGVNILAAVDGVVTFTQDGLFDKETEGDVSKLLGNYIAISHPNKYYSYYGHLKKNSLVVKEGDSVKAGDIIAQVGSSGNSTDPHLHFELWYDSLYVVDPFTGPCGNPQSLWLDDLPYDTSFGVFESGFKLKTQLTINDLRFRDSSYTSSLQIPPSSNSSLNFWSHLYGLRTNDELRIQWLTPSNIEWFSFSTTIDQDYWYYYYWTFINHENLAEGEWTVVLNRNNTKIAEQKFEVEQLTNVRDKHFQSDCEQLTSESLTTLQRLYGEELTITDMSGKQLYLYENEAFPSGIYQLELKTRDFICRVKRKIVHGK